MLSQCMWLEMLPLLWVSSQGKNETKNDWDSVIFNIYRVSVFHM